MRPSSALFAAALLGCAPATVDTVQPGAVAKDVFEGEWYWRDTVAEVPYGTAVSFVGAQTELERVRWKVEEDLLLGYRSYENVDDADATGAGTYYGAPLLAYRIEKHFDIRRSYDRTTGEEGNVIEENVERPWYERAYMRVDWSTNLAEAGWTFAGVPLEVLDFTTDDPTDAGAPQLDDTDGDGIVDSVLLTTRVLAEPDTTLIPGYGDVPVCLFYGQAEYECGASEVAIRSSFLRVDRPAYEGLAYDDTWMETFGFFLTERLAYDRAYGLVEPNRTFWANRHDLWAESYVTDDLGLVQCEAGGAVRACALFEADEHPVPVRIPYAEREVAPIVFHAGPGFPADLLPIMEDVAAEWNAPFRDAVNGARFWECMDGGGKKKDCEALRDDDLQVFVFCPNNPSLPGDPAVCSTDHTGPLGRPDGIGDEVLPGDLRYHLVHVVDNPHLSSPFGYGPSAADPVGTDLPLLDGALRLGAGEIVSANAFVYGHVLDRIAHQVADMVQLINGELDPAGFVEGENVEAWVDALRTGSVDALVGATHGIPARLDRAEVERRLGRISNGFGALVHAELDGLPAPTDPPSFRAWLDEVQGALSRHAGAGPAEDLLQLEQLVDSPFDELMWSRETIGAYGWDPSATAPPAGASPLDLLHPTALAEQEAGLVLAGRHAVDLEAASFTDGPLLGLARHYAASGLTYDAIVQDVRENLFREVVLHEIGHTVGLRHNFAGSFDAFNYHPTYWALRDDGDMGPRHVDPETEAEVDGRIREYQYASIMDYPGSRAGGWHGLGKYDRAAVKFGYGQLVEVMTAVPGGATVPGLPNDEAIGWLSFFAGFTAYPTIALQYTSGDFLELHYTDLPAIAGDLEARADVPLAHLVPTFSDEPGFSAMLTTGDARGVDVGLPAAPYRFCSDEVAVGTTCARFDEGADPYEVQTFLMEQYWNHYLLNNFARDRYGWGSTGGYVSALQARVFEPLRTWQRYYGLFHGVYGVERDGQAADFFAADRGFGGWTAATDEAFRFLTRIVVRPEPGPHASVERPDGVTHLAPSLDGAEIPLVAGAYYESDWDDASGYHWFERQSRVGTYWDRMLALFTLTTTSSDGFLGYDTAIDPRAYSIGFQDLYGDALGLFLAELMAGEVERLGPVLDGEALVYRDVLDLQAAWPPASGELVSPAAYWLVQYDAGLFGKALLADGYDRTFLNRGRVYVEGSSDEIAAPPDQPTVRYTDPTSGKTWVAWSFPVDGVELGSGARMVLKAQRLQALCDDGYQAGLACDELARFASDLDLQAQIHAWFDAP